MAMYEKEKREKSDRALSGSRRHATKALAAVSASLLASGCSRSKATGSLEVSGVPIANGTATAAKNLLTAAPAAVRLVPDSRPKTPVWAYGGTVPGTALTVQQNEIIDVTFENGLPEPSTVHWHGIRLPNAMDGVPHLTQAPVEPGERFRYTYRAPDAGTYWYHPHLGTPEQVGRGLYGTVIVQEAEPPDIDRDLVWLIDDWRLDGQARIIEDFYRWSDVAFDGRVGNTVTVNGMEHYRETVTFGERIRIRLINTANARMLSLSFGQHPAWLLALDGQPLPEVSPLGPADNVFLGPGQRADVIVDLVAADGGTIPVIDRLNPARAFSLAAFEYAAASGRPSAAKRPAPRPLMPNSILEPAQQDRLPVSIVMDGGMMRGPSVPWTQRLGRRLRQWAGSKEAYPSWSLNGRAHMGHGKDHPFEFEAELGQTVEISYQNRSSKWHPMHLHGHHFRELTRNGKPVPMTPWRDTTMVAPRETLVIAFVADNPGDWLIHCHILEHHAGGMGTQFRVNS